MFERFTDRARTAVIRARATAAGRGDQIRPVYLLHALATAEGAAARALAGLGVDAGTIERQMDRVAPRGRPLEGEADSADAEALASIGIDLDEIKRRVEESFGPGTLGRGAGAAGPGQPGRPGNDDRRGEAVAGPGGQRRPGRCVTPTSVTSTCCSACWARRNSARAGTSPLDTLRDLGIDPAQARQRVLDELRHAPGPYLIDSII